MAAAAAVCCQVVAWLLISVSLPRLPAVVTSVVLMLQPVGAVVLGIVLLREDPSVVQLIGVAAVLSGVAVVTLGRRRAAPAASATRTEQPVASGP